MKKLVTKKIAVYSSLFSLILMAGCFTILNVQQPTSATRGEQITVKLLVRTEADPDWGLINDGQYGIVGIMIPDDWFIDSVKYCAHQGAPGSSDVFGGDMAYLDPADPDNSPGGKVDYWTDTLDVHYPPPSGMHWEVFQSIKEDSTQRDTGYVDVFIKMTVGQNDGTYDLAYFVSMATLDFDYERYHSYSSGNPITVSATGIDDKNGIQPSQVNLFQNYPNPFNPQTAIRYTLKERCNVILSVFDLTGKSVSTLVKEVQNAGEHTILFNADHLPSGIYLYQLKAGAKIFTRKMVLIK